MMYYERERFKIVLMNTLEEKGWTFYYKGWDWIGIAVKNDCILVIDQKDNWYSGRKVDEPRTKVPRYNPNNKGYTWHIEWNGFVLDEGRLPNGLIQQERRATSLLCKLKSGEELTKDEQLVLKAINDLATRFEKVASNPYWDQCLVDINQANLIVQ